MSLPGRCRRSSTIGATISRRLSSASKAATRNDGSAMLEMPPFMIASYMLRNFPASWMSSSSVITSSGTSIT